MSKRATLDAFFSPKANKRQKLTSPTTTSANGAPVDGLKHAEDIADANVIVGDEEALTFTRHPSWPVPIANLPDLINEPLDFIPAEEPRTLTNHPHLDLLYFQPYIPQPTANRLFNFLRANLPFYRVKYQIKRGPTPTQINTPRFTTVFGLDETSRFSQPLTSPDGGSIIDMTTGKPVPRTAYKCRPRPIPPCLQRLLTLTENATGARFNFCLVNYYADGTDSISYHSDDERFLGVDPAIASLTLGASRDFLLRLKPQYHPPNTQQDGKRLQPLKFPLASGDMLLMRGETQKCWEHSVPKRQGPGAQKGRINITFRRAMVKGGTENYYNYNVGSGPLYRWSEEQRKMVEESKVEG